MPDLSLVTDQLLDDLDAKARAATPGPWVSTQGPRFRGAVSTLDERQVASADGQAAMFDEGRGMSTQEVLHANADHIAAANPQTVLMLTAMIRKLRDDLQRQVYDRGGAEDGAEKQQAKLEADLVEMTTKHHAAVELTGKYAGLAARLRERARLWKSRARKYYGLACMLDYQRRERDAAKQHAWECSQALEKAHDRIRVLESFERQYGTCIVSLAERDDKITELEQAAIANNTSWDACQADRADLQRKLVELQDDKDHLLDAIDKDATGLASALAAIKREITGRSWIAESRGPYEWNDDRYRTETYQAFQSITKILDPALSESGTRANEAWRSFERGRVLKLSVELERVREVARRFGSRDCAGTPDTDVCAKRLSEEPEITACDCGATAHNARLHEELHSDLPVRATVADLQRQIASLKPDAELWRAAHELLRSRMAPRSESAMECLAELLSERGYHPDDRDSLINLMLRANIPVVQTEQAVTVDRGTIKVSFVFSDERDLGKLIGMVAVRP